MSYEVIKADGLPEIWLRKSNPPMFNFGLAFVGEWVNHEPNIIWIIEFSCGCSCTVNGLTNFYSQVDVCESHPEV